MCQTKSSVTQSFIHHPLLSTLQEFMHMLYITQRCHLASPFTLTCSCCPSGPVTQSFRRMDEVFYIESVVFCPERAEESLAEGQDPHCHHPRPHLENARLLSLPANHSNISRGLPGWRKKAKNICGFV